MSYTSYSTTYRRDDDRHDPVRQPYDDDTQYHIDDDFFGFGRTFFGEREKYKIRTSGDDVDHGDDGYVREKLFYHILDCLRDGLVRLYTALSECLTRLIHSFTDTVASTAVDLYTDISSVAKREEAICIYIRKS